LRIDQVLRSVVPRRVVSALRLLQIFQQKHGHVRCEDGFPVNGKGEYQPWLTYPMIEFLNFLDFSEKTVFEYGAGSSTLYWSRRAKQVISVELDRGWYESLLPRVPANVQLIHEPDGGKYSNIIHDFNYQFHVIVIDGAERNASAVAAIQALAPGGMIILDNAEWYPNTAEYLSSSGLIEVPFSGFSPINAFTATSTAFISRDFAMSRSKEARQPPIGGRALPTPALDDVSTEEGAE